MSEFVRRVVLGNVHTAITAEPAELEAVAKRLRLPAILALRCAFDIAPARGADYALQGELQARIRQECVMTRDVFEAVLKERFELRLVPAGRETPEIDPEAIDDIPYDDNTIDLGDLAVEQLALLLDPYPRKPGASLPAYEAGDTPNPFAPLASLRPGKA